MPSETYLRGSAVNHDDHRPGCLRVGSTAPWNKLKRARTITAELIASRTTSMSATTSLLPSTLRPPSIQPAGSVGTLRAGDVEDYQVRSCSTRIWLISNATLQRATSLSRDGSLLLAAGLHLVSQTALPRFPQTVYYHYSFVSSIFPPLNQRLLRLRLKTISTMRSSPRSRSVELTHPFTSKLMGPVLDNYRHIRKHSGFPHTGRQCKKTFEGHSNYTRPANTGRGWEIHVPFGEVSKSFIFAFGCDSNIPVRFNPSDENILYTISNTTASRARARSKVTPRQAYISKWDVSSWEVTKSRKVSDKAVTCFDMR